MSAIGARLPANSVTSNSIPPDAELALRVASGDADALEELYNRYSPAVFSMSYSILRDHAAAEDATQEIFLALWSRASRFHPAKGVFRHWFLHLAHNRIIDELRRRRRATQLDADASPDDAKLPLASPADTANEAITAALFGAASEALKALPEEQRIPIVMAYLEGATQQEIAARANIPLGTVKTRLRLGLAKLRELLAAPGALNPKTPASSPPPWTP